MTASSFTSQRRIISIYPLRGCQLKHWQFQYVKNFVNLFQLTYYNNNEINPYKQIFV